ncbi:MAG: hypothetical protein KYX63_08090 [Alteromonas macleodii]|nr:hypothetical protein [Alteromonas macleodii]
MELRTELVLIAISAMIGMVFGIGLAKGIDYSFFSAFGAMLAGIGALGTWYIAYKALDSWKAKRDYGELTSLQASLESNLEKLNNSLTAIKNYVFYNYYKHPELGAKGLDVKYTDLLYHVVDNERKVFRNIDDILLILEEHEGALPESLLKLSAFFLGNTPDNYELHKQGLIERYIRKEHSKSTFRHSVLMTGQIQAARILKEDIRKLI